jgi:hypothetical protein
VNLLSETFVWLFVVLKFLQHIVITGHVIEYVSVRITAPVLRDRHAVDTWNRSIMHQKFSAFVTSQQINVKLFYPNPCILSHLRFLKYLTGLNETWCLHPATVFPISYSNANRNKLLKWKRQFCQLIAGIWNFRLLLLSGIYLLRVLASSFFRFRDHTQGRTTVGRTPLDEWSARRRDLYLTIHTTLTTDNHPCPLRDSNPQS